jgi:hypothetical protein
MQFSVPDLNLKSIRQVDNLPIKGSYKGKPVRQVLFFDHEEKCMMLSDSSSSPRFENLFCFERDGHTVWTAPLPSTHDAFVAIRLEPKGLLAQL